jgi:hypothetical protein
LFGSRASLGDIAGAGSIYRHDYEDVAAQHVWEAAQMDLSSLRAVITQELAALDRPSAGQQTTKDPKT